MKNDTVDNLKRLFELFNSGQISEEEFEFLKSRLISPEKTESSEKNLFKEEIHEKPQQKKEEEIQTKVEVKPKQEAKAISIAGKVAFVFVLIGLIVSIFLYFRASNERDVATIALASAEKRIEQLSGSIDSLRIATTTNQINSSVSIPIPTGISERILIIKKYFPDMIPQNAALYKINDGKSFELRFPDFCSGFSETTIQIANQDSDLWIFNEPPCGSGGSERTGAFLFTYSKNFMVFINAITSCSGASDCYDLVNVYVNGENIKSIRQKINW